MKKDYDRFGGLLLVLFWIQIIVAAWFGGLLIRDVILLMGTTEIANEKIMIASVLAGLVVLISLIVIAIMRLKGKFFYGLIKILMSANILMMFFNLIASLFMPLLYEWKLALAFFGIPLIIQSIVLFSFLQSKHAKVYYRV